MNKLLRNILTTLLSASLLFLNFTYSFADEILPTELLAANISYEFISTVYNGKAQKPKVTVTSGDKVLTENEDFTVTYPDDCVNAGLKTLLVSGMGGYGGNFSGTYRIEPLDVSGDGVQFTAVAEACTYSGYAQTPGFTVTVNGLKVPEDSYSMRWSNNVNVTQKAVCGFSFSGNFTGTRNAEFTIAKTERTDLDIEIPIDFTGSNGKVEFSYDLSKLLPKGAYCGLPSYSAWDFPTGAPTVAFNELRCTVNEEANKATIGIPVRGAANYEDFYINFYFKPTVKIRPSLVIKPIDREYNGKPVTDDEIAEAGCYAVSDGKVIEGKWIFWKNMSGEPHPELPFVCTFLPGDPAYESVDGIIPVTVRKVSLSDFSVTVNSSKVSPGGRTTLTVEGVPEELAGLLKLEISPGTDDFSFEEYPGKDSLKFKLTLPYEDGLFTVTASIPGDGYRAAAVSSVEIVVGNYVPPEVQIPDKVTTADELADLIAAAEQDSTITVLGMRTISAASLGEASRKNLTVEVKLNGTYTWVLRTGKLSTVTSAVDLELGTASIPSVLVGQVGGVAVNSFTVNQKYPENFASLRIAVKDIKNGSYANLFHYSTSGDLEFLQCDKPGDKKAVEFAVAKAGKFTVIADSETKLMGDIDNSCKLDIYDVAELLTLVLSSDLPANLSKLDIDGNGFLNILDVADLLTLVLS